MFHILLQIIIIIVYIIHLQHMTPISSHLGRSPGLGIPAYGDGPHVGDICPISDPYSSYRSRASSLSRDLFVPGVMASPTGVCPSSLILESISTGTAISPGP
jgi:hypothetical protein